MTLRAEIDRLQSSIERQSVALTSLQNQSTKSRGYEPVQQSSSDRQKEIQLWTEGFLNLRDALAALADQVGGIKTVLEEVLAGVRQVRS